MTNFLSITTFAIAILCGCGLPQTEIEADVLPTVAFSFEDDAQITNILIPEGISFSSRRIKKVADKTRVAVVEVHNNGRGVRGTGTYFKFKGHYIVLTAAHVVDGGAGLMEIRTPNGESTAGLVLLFDNRSPSDYAILLVKGELTTRTAMDLKIRKDPTTAVGESVVYTGDPGQHRQMTIFGNVSGFAKDGSIIMHSYAWAGASGSAVFDNKGRLVGVLKAVDVNLSRVSPFPQVTEDMVWLSPGRSIVLKDLETILIVYELIMELQNGGASR